jgi:cell division protein FtsB
MREGRNFFRDVGPIILRLEQRTAAWNRLSAAEFRVWALRLGVAALLVVLLVWGRVRVLANGYQIAELKERRDALLLERRRLERRLAEMQSLRYAEVQARQRLGMVDINPNQVINLKQPSAGGRLLEGVASFFGAGKQEAP